MGQRRLATLCGTLPRAWVHFDNPTSSVLGSLEQLQLDPEQF